MRLTLNLALAAKYQPEDKVERVVPNALARPDFEPDAG